LVCGFHLSLRFHSIPSSTIRLIEIEKDLAWWNYEFGPCGLKLVEYSGYWRHLPHGQNLQFYGSSGSALFRRRIDVREDHKRADANGRPEKLDQYLEE
jgi:hypothetical protein